MNYGGCPKSVCMTISEAVKDRIFVESEKCCDIPNSDAVSMFPKYWEQIRKFVFQKMSQIW